MAAEQSSVHQRAIDALMQLLAEQSWENITLSDIATLAELTLAELRGAFPSKGAVLSGFSRMIDQEVLRAEGIAADLSSEPARERLFDVMMRRLDALQPYKAAIRSARTGLLRDPMAASAWNRVEVTSAQWMLAAAGIAESGPGASLKAQGLALIWAQVLGTWLEEDDPDMPRTLRALDQALRRGERVAQTGDMALQACAPIISAMGSLIGSLTSRRRRDAPRTEADDPAAVI